MSRYLFALTLCSWPSWTAASDWQDGRLEGGQAGSRLGRSLATADVNGDGFGDLIVGAPGYDDDQANEGRVLVYHGSLGGLSATPDWMRHGNQRGAHFGAAVASAGDVNGDGYEDVIIGAPAADGGASGEKHFYVGALDEHASHDTDEGRVHLFLGSASGLAGAPQRTVNGIERDERFGTALAGVGDVNGDGYDDVLVGAPGKSEGFGALFLFPGSASGMAPFPSWIEVGDAAGTGWGSVLGAAGDVNEDGFADLLGSASGAGACGELRLYYGSALGPGSTPDKTISERVSALGPSIDYDENGILDTLYVGGGCGVPQVKRRDFVTDSSGSLPILGAAHAVTAGDLNGDGRVDLVASAPQFSYGPFQGRVFVYTNRPGLTFAPEASFPIYDGDQAGAGWGEALASTDVDGDGADELFVAAPRYGAEEELEGLVQMFPGVAEHLVLVPTPYTPLSSSQGSIATVGDFDDDGYSDLLAGQSVRYGSPAGLGASSDGTITKPTTEFCYEAYVGISSTGDVNGDGFDDALVDYHAVFVCHGGYALLPQQHQLHAGGPMGLSLPPTQIFPGSCCYEDAETVGDVNGDGYDDALIENGPSEDLHLGSEWGLSSDPWQTLPSEYLQGSGRHRAILPGDLNGDAYGDLLLAHYEQSLGIYHGSSSGLVFQGDWTELQSFGDDTLTLTLQDVDGDGLDDLLVEDDEDTTGRCLVYRGSPSGFVRAPQWWEPANVAGSLETFWNNRVLALADVDGNGYADLLLEGERVHLGSAQGISRAPAWVGALTFPPQRIHDAADFNGNGRVELCAYAYPSWYFFEVLF